MTLRPCLTLAQPYFFLLYKWIIPVFYLQFNTSVQFHCHLQFALKPSNKLPPHFLFPCEILEFLFSFYVFPFLPVSLSWQLCSCVLVWLFVGLVIFKFVCFHFLYVSVSCLPGYMFPNVHVWSQMRPEEGVRSPRTNDFYPQVGARSWTQGLWESDKCFCLQSQPFGPKYMCILIASFKRFFVN